MAIPAAARDPWRRVPPSVSAVLERLHAVGEEAVLVGGCVRDLVRGASVHDWDVATSAAPATVLACFPRAVPVGLRFGTVMVPTAAGPVDVTRFRADDLEGDLARRDFTANALALAPGEDAPLDLAGGLADLAAGRLRAVGRAGDRLAEDPLRALRAARLRAELGLVPDDALEAAMAAVGPRIAAIAVERVRGELERMLVAPEAGAGVALLRRTGLESRLVGPAREDTAAVVDAVAPERVVRWAAWLRDLGAGVLARLRVSQRRVREVATLLALHPIDERTRPTPPDARRLLRRAGPAGVESLLALREAECRLGSAPEGAGAALARWRRLLAEVRRAGRLALAREDLALDGRAVMETLGCGPGPVVGRALRHLTECVLDDPACNTPERLRERLRAWREGGDAPGGRDAGPQP